MPINCIIVEDEEYAALYLERQILTAGLGLQVQAKLDTVEDTVKWLHENSTDIIFLDIQLGDGLSFEIFDHLQINTPIIFITSYNEYAIKAFEQNSIAYLLKPVKQSDLVKAIEKYDRLFTINDGTKQQFSKLHDTFQHKFMVYVGSVMQTLRSNDIDYFKLQDKRYLFAVANQQQFMYDSSLELLESRLDPSVFFRINRQIIVNKDYIKQLKQMERGRLLIITNTPSKEDLVVSIGRAKAFKEWFNV